MRNRAQLISGDVRTASIHAKIRRWIIVISLFLIFCCTGLIWLKHTIISSGAYEFAVSERLRQIGSHEHVRHEYCFSCGGRFPVPLLSTHGGYFFSLIETRGNEETVIKVYVQERDGRFTEAKFWNSADE
jgi:hypothetical protein